MAGSKLVLAGIAATVLITIFGALLFFQTKDPTMLEVALRGSLLAWLIALVVHVLRHGIPVRIVADDRK